jgi:DNA-binding response OmpR family regulator
MIDQINSYLLSKSHDPAEPLDAHCPIGPMGIGARGRILVADDNPGIRRLLSVNLKLHGFLADAVADGDLALERFREDSYDLVITDLMMQRMTGDELARHVWALAPDQPVLFISGRCPEAVKRLVDRHPSARFLGKPITPGQLVDEVVRLLERTQGHAVRA